jgi:DNA-binding XRE family transcriptional regulator
MKKPSKVYPHKPLNDRFMQLMKEFRYSNTTFAKALGVSASTIGYIDIYRSYPSMETMLKLLELHPNVNVNWLIKGEGEKFVGHSLEDAIEAQRQKIEYLEEKERQMVSTIKHWMGRFTECEKENITIKIEKQQALEELAQLKESLR